MPDDKNISDDMSIDDIIDTFGETVLSPEEWKIAMPMWYGNPESHYPTGGKC